MANNRMTELEAMLYRQLDDQKKATDDLLKAVNIRNWERVEEQKNDYNASQMRNKVMMMGLLSWQPVPWVRSYSTRLLSGFSEHGRDQLG